MKYTTISADAHIDMTWLPGDLFTSNVSAQWKEAVPKVVETKEGFRWQILPGGNGECNVHGRPTCLLRHGKTRCLLFRSSEDPPTLEESMGSRSLSGSLLHDSDSYGDL